MLFVLLIASHSYIMMEQTSRMYWPYMIVTYVIAGLFYLLYERKYHKNEVASSLREYLFSKDLWFHRSAIQDYVLFLVNYLVLYTIFNALIFKPEQMQETVRIAAGMIQIAMGTISLPHTEDAPGFFIILLYTLCSFLMTELSYYIWHRTMHRIPVLWEFHKVHHSAEVLTPITYIRAHPFELWGQSILRLIFLGIASGIFYYFYPNMHGLITIAHVDLGLFIMYIIGGNLHHSHVWITFGKYVEHLIMSPAQHQIHHSIDPKHYNRNFGSMTALWDWVFGTLYIIKGREKITFGLQGNDAKGMHSVWSMYIHPVKNLVKKSIGTRDNA